MNTQAIVTGAWLEVDAVEDAARASGAARELGYPGGLVEIMYESGLIVAISL